MSCMHSRRLIFCLAFALTACGGLQPLGGGPSGVRERVPAASAPAPVRNDEAEQVGALIAYSHWLTTARAEEQRREVSAVTQSLARDAGAYARVKLALLLAVPGSGFTDENRAMALLEPLAAGASVAASGAGNAAHAGGPLSEFAFLLHAQLGERVREQKRSAQLREQLDALKAIERSLIERGQPQKK